MRTRLLSVLFLSLSVAEVYRQPPLGADGGGQGVKLFPPPRNNIFRTNGFSGTQGWQTKPRDETLLISALHLHFDAFGS